MRQTDQDFIDRLKLGPTFLFLGQATWALQDGADPVLAAVQHLSNFEGSGLADPRSVAEGWEAAYQRLNELTVRGALPPSVHELARVPWNGVLTSGIDSRVTRTFEADWRRVLTLTGVDSDARTPRSPTELNLWMLFGGVQLSDDDRPPTDAFTFAIHHQRAQETLSYLADALITPRGVLAIEGYDPNTDWLSPETLVGLLNRLQPGQAHLFSATEEVVSNPLIAAAIQRSLVTAHVESLPALLSSHPSLDVGLLQGGVSSAKVIRLGGDAVELPADLWNSTITSARPMDDVVLRPYGRASDAVRYQRFRSFMGATDGATDWAAIASGFNFEREFESLLWNRAHEDASSAGQSEPLILEGQTSSGKSIALAALGVRLANEGRLAALHVSSQFGRPQRAAIDRFAAWAETKGAEGTVLLWDGMADSDEYFELHRELKARGRRVAIVGTSYIDIARRRRRAVLAPAQLTEAESSRLAGWLSSFGIELSDRDLSYIADHPSFLGVLYRLLPDSRRKVRDGLSLELRRAEADMERLAKEYRSAAELQSEMSSMAYALAKAGIELPDFVRRDATTPVVEVPFGQRSTAEQLTAIVVAAGRRNLKVPLELVLRTIGRDGASVVVDVVKQFDIIRWTDDERGDQFLGTRNSLEAELLASADLRDARREVDVICALLSHLKPGSGAGGPEVEFAVDLLKRIGPDSPDRARFVSHYLLICAALAEARTKTSRPHERLVLYEANFAREWVMWAQDRDEPDTSRAERLRVLETAGQLLEETLPGAQHPNNRRNLLVEFASVLGARAYEQSTPDAPSGDLYPIAAKIVELIGEARALDQENYYPVDVLSWVSVRLVQKGYVSQRDGVNLAADALASLVGLERANLSQKQQAMYDGRMRQLAKLLGDDALSEQQLDLLSQNDDPAAYFLLALIDSGLAAHDDGIPNPAALETALERLRNAPEPVRQDWRCARFMLDLFWMVKTGKRFMQGDRETLAFESSDWEQCLDMVALARGLASFDQYRADFLRGLAYFHLGSMQQMFTAFEQLNRETQSLTRRVIATYVFADASGTPVKLTGQVKSVRPDGSNGRVWIPELGIELPFIPRRFNLDDIRPNSLLPDFWISFNMRGPYADPVRSGPGPS